MDIADSYVFISYARQNQALASELYQRLSSKVTCWMDQYDIPIDERVFQEHILEGIQHASALVLVKTRQAQESAYVAREVAEADEAGVPVYTYRIRSEGKLRGLKDFFRQVKVALLATRIKLRITQPFWLSTLLMGTVILAMGAFVFWVSKRVTPVVAEAIQRSLPEAAQVAPFVQPPPSIDPKIAAPFFFVPDVTFLADEFEGEGTIDETLYYYDIRPTYDDVQIYQEDGLLHLQYPGDCLREEFRWGCETEIHGPDINLMDIQYFGLRTRAVDMTNLKDFSISLSTSGPRRWRTGFGWAFSDHVTPFFRANSNLPEVDFYAYLPLDDQWHAYEILLDPQGAVLFYYVDGQLITKIEMRHMEDWLGAPLMVMFFIDAVDDVQSTTVEINPNTYFQMDQLILGGYQ